MNSPVNRTDVSPRSSNKQKSEVQTQATETANAAVEQVATVEEETAQSNQTNQTTVERQHPIGAPSNPKQYRAIGVIKGQYQPSEEQLTQGSLLDTTGRLIEAVVLGRVISLVKNHLDLQQDHLWVVYPHTKKESDDLHLQIVGIWEPETLKKDLINQSEGNPEDKFAEIRSSAEIKENYFSIRGEVIFYSTEKEVIVVKIRQSPKKDSDKPKFFKLKLKGILGDKPIGHFWDLQVKFQDNNLAIQEATDLGPLAAKKPFAKRGQKKFPPKRGGGGKTSDSYPNAKESKTEGSLSKENSTPNSKPVKRKNP